MVEIIRADSNTERMGGSSTNEIAVAFLPSVRRGGKIE
jgi:hypothetical protein